MKNLIIIILGIHFSLNSFSQSCSKEPLDPKQAMITQFIQKTIGTNLYEVDPGRYYRSAQLTEENLRKIIKNYNIRTVINLQGAIEEADWFQMESRVTKELGVEHINISMKSSQIPTKKALIELLDAFKYAQKPMLIHCQLGADRTGLATAIYGMEYLKQPKNVAHSANLSYKFFHLLPKTIAMDYFFKEVYQNESWARNQYQPCKSNYQYFDKTKSCCGDSLDF